MALWATGIAVFFLHLSFVWGLDIEGLERERDDEHMKLCEMERS